MKNVHRLDMRDSTFPLFPSLSVTENVFDEVRRLADGLKVIPDTRQS
jgi:hypothetical protein